MGVLGCATRAVWQVAFDDSRRLTVGARVASKWRVVDQKLSWSWLNEVEWLKLHVQEIDGTWRLDPVVQQRQQLSDLASSRRIN